MATEDKRQTLRERLERLELQLDYLTNERTKISAHAFQDKDYLQRLKKLVTPTFLMADSLLLNCFKELDAFEQNAMETLQTAFLQMFKFIESVFINYMQMNQMVIDIKAPNSSQNASIDQNSVKEAILFYRQKNSELKATLFDQFYEKYDIAIDNASNRVITYFQNIVKVFDTFQIKITEFNRILSQDTSAAFLQFPVQVDIVDEGIEQFRKRLHLLGERPIFQAVEELCKILTYIIEKAAKEIDQTNLFTQAQFIEYIGQEYEKLEEINQRLADSINGHLEVALEQNLPKINEIFEHFSSDVKQIQYLFDLDKISQNASTNSNSDYLMNIDAKMEDIIARIEQIKKEIQDISEK